MLGGTAAPKIPAHMILKLFNELGLQACSVDTSISSGNNKTLLQA